MTWYPTDTQAREPHVLVKAWRKLSAAARWAILVVGTGLALAAVIGLAVSALFTAIENGL